LNCSHVLGLVDAGPLADFPREHRDAARRHALSCPTCGAALLASETIDTALAALPQPAVPRDLAAGILARIARIDEPAPASVRAASASRVSSFRGYPSLAAVAAGAVLAIGVLASGPSPIEVQSLGFARTSMGLVVMPVTIAGAMGVAGGLALYALGLFMPLAVREEVRSGDEH
jgi:hypothetical protein